MATVQEPNGEADNAIVDTVVQQEGDEADEEDDVDVIAYTEIVYGVESFYAIVKPVFLAMLLSALCVTYIGTPESREAGQESLSNTYLVFGSTDEEESTGRQLGQSLANGIVIVAVICGMTFLLVILYKYRCMKVLIGYMIVSLSLLLGLLSSSMFMVAVERYGLTIDKFTFWFLIFNFAIVGVASIFWSKGIPAWITQLYLISASVIVAWQLSQFDPWTSWVLLILLALYDLFAVLTPCGPLKALVNLMQRDDAPEMPGLLYEASLPDNARRRQPLNQHQRQQSENEESSCAQNRQSMNTTAPRSSLAASTAASSSSIVRNNNVASSYTANHPANMEQLPEAANSANTQSTDDEKDKTENGDDSSSASIVRPLAVYQSDIEEPPRPTGRIPLALAKMYKLPLVDGSQPSWLRWRPSLVDNEEATSAPEETFTPEQLCEEVNVVFPRGGGRLEPYAKQRRTEETRYVVIDRHGNQKRILFVNPEGRVFQDLREQNAAEEAAQRKKDRNSIKLGLGDFIFYSILVSKAALYSFTAFIACTVAILTGLGATLLILAIRGHALPALPISIFLGVIFYLLTRYLIEPWIQDIFIEQSYV